MPNFGRGFALETKFAGQFNAVLCGSAPQNPRFTNDRFVSGWTKKAAMAKDCFGVEGCHSVAAR
jgi:hypothetical protein